MMTDLLSPARRIISNIAFAAVSIPLVPLLTIAICPLATAAGELPNSRKVTSAPDSSTPAALSAAYTLLNPLPANWPQSQTELYLWREVQDHEVYSNSRLIRPLLKRDGNSLWESVLRSKQIPVPEQDRIDFFRQQYRQDAFWVSKMLQRASPFAGYIVDALDAQSLPLELALLPAIESGYRPDVISNQNAAGIWQLISATAEEVGVQRTAWFDGRADIRLSTWAASHYLSYLNARFDGDWLLTLAAYNAGPGRVSEALKENTNSGLPTDFWSLKLPTETRDYVPKFLGLLAMLRYDTVPKLTIPTLAHGAGFNLVNVEAGVSLADVSVMTGLPLRELTTLNAGLTLKVAPPNGPHGIYLPDRYLRRLANYRRETQSAGLFTTIYIHQVKPGDSLRSLASLHGTTTKHLMQLNSLADSTIRVGQLLWLTDAPGVIRKQAATG